MADSTYKPAVYRKQGGDEMVVASGGLITTEEGGYTLDSVAAVTALGANQGAAAPLTAEVNVVASANGALGVRLPTAQVGMRIIVKNNAAGILLVYPATGATINALSANAAFEQYNLTCAEFIATSTTAWFTLPLTVS